VNRSCHQGAASVESVKVEVHGDAFRFPRSSFGNVPVGASVATALRARLRCGRSRLKTPHRGVATLIATNRKQGEREDDKWFSLNIVFWFLTFMGSPLSRQ